MFAATDYVFEVTMHLRMTFHAFPPSGSEVEEEEALGRADASPFRLREEQDFETRRDKCMQEKREPIPIYQAGEAQ